VTRWHLLGTQVAGPSRVRRKPRAGGTAASPRDRRARVHRILVRVDRKLHD
jgi:hypothetical protein